MTIRNPRWIVGGSGRASDGHLKSLLVSRKWRSVIYLVPGVIIEVTPSPPQRPWKHAFRWEIPQFPPGDSVKFGFQIIQPKGEEYKAFLDSKSNVILEKTKVDTGTEGSSFTEHSLGLLGAAIGMIVAIILTSQVLNRGTDLVSDSHALVDLVAGAEMRGASAGMQYVQTVSGEGYRLRVISRAYPAQDGWSYVYHVFNIGDNSARFSWNDSEGKPRMSQE